MRIKKTKYGRKIREAKANDEDELLNEVSSWIIKDDECDESWEWIIPKQYNNGEKINMEIKCLRCKQEFEIGKEQLKKIDEIVIGKTFRPKDYLRFFPFISGDCKDGKGHDFVFTDAFSDKKKAIIQVYDETNKYIAAGKESLKLMADKEKGLGLEKEKLTKRLDEIRDELFANDQSINAISLVKIPADEAQIECILSRFEELCGTRDIESWKDVIIASIESKTNITEIKK